MFNMVDFSCLACELVEAFRRRGVPSIPDGRRKRITEIVIRSMFDHQVRRSFTQAIEADCLRLGTMKAFKTWDLDSCMELPYKTFHSQGLDALSDEHLALAVLRPLELHLLALTLDRKMDSGEASEVWWDERHRYGLELPALDSEGMLQDVISDQQEK